jgi:CBS domain-containing membrane protein
MQPHLVVADIMTRNVRTLREHDKLSDIAKQMGEYHFRHLPVEEDGKLVGLVSQRDLLRLTGNARERTELAQKLGKKIDEITSVEDLMHKDVRAVTPRTPLLQAAQMLLDTKAGCLPVVDTDHTIIGIITEYDFVKLAVALLERKRRASTPAEKGR